jgi:hypothetical protein
MDTIISKWTSMLTEATSGGLALVAVVAGVAIIVFVIMGIFSDDTGRAGTVKTIVCVLIFCAVAACGTSLVQWALS